MRRIMSGIGASVVLLVLILDAKTAFAGAVDGLSLCIQTIIPSLTPFFFISILMTGILCGVRLPFLSPITRLCRMPSGSEALFAVGMLGGYPVGAQAVAQAFRLGQLSRLDAHRLLGFCSNAGPAFLFGIVAVKFSSPVYGWILWLIHIFSAITTAVLLPGASHSYVRPKYHTVVSMSDAVKQTVTVMASVCTWVILFRVLVAFFSSWFLWLFDESVQVSIIGILELANGCCQLELIKNEGLRFVICSAILSLGGLCVVMQTLSVTAELGLGMYFPGKLLQCGISVMLSAVLQYFMFSDNPGQYLNPFILIPATLFVVTFAFFLHKKQKNSSNCQLVVV